MADIVDNTNTETTDPTGGLPVASDSSAAALLSGGASAPGDATGPAPVQDAQTVQVSAADPTTDPSAPQVQPNTAAPTQIQPGQPQGFVSGDRVMPGVRTSKWENILMGALQGMSAGAGQKFFGTGMAAGAKTVNDLHQQDVENQQKQQQIDTQSRVADSTIKFQSAQAASALADAAVKDASLHALPQKIQDEHNTAQATNVRDLTVAFGGPPTYVVNNTATDVKTVMAQISQQNGGIGHMFIVNGGDKIYAWDISNIGASDPLMDMLHRAGKIGNPLLARMTATDWKALPTAQKTQYLSQAEGVLGVITPSKDPKEQQSQLSVLDTQQKTVEALPVDDPDRSVMLGNISRNRALVQSAIAADDKHETQQAVRKAVATETATQPIKVQTAAKSAQAKMTATGQDQEHMFKTGVNPITGEQLSLGNAPDSMMVDSKGNPIAKDNLASMKPSQSESNRADFAKSVIHGLDQIDQLKASGKLPNGPLKGITVKKLIAVGLAPKNAQEAYNYISFVQSAATGAHVGGRFSVPVMEKMNGLIGLNMNDGQFQGAEDSIRNVMQGYVDSGGRMTVGEYKASNPNWASGNTDTGGGHNGGSTSKPQVNKPAQPSGQGRSTGGSWFAKHGGQG